MTFDQLLSIKFKQQQNFTPYKYPTVDVLGAFAKHDLSQWALVVGDRVDVLEIKYLLYLRENYLLKSSKNMKIILTSFPKESKWNNQIA